MLTHPTNEADTGRIVITDVNARIFEGLLRFIYTGQLKPGFLEDYAEDLFCAADKYDVQDLLSLCEARLLGNVKAENALVMFDLAQRRPESRLAKKCYEIISGLVHGIFLGAKVFSVGFKDVRTNFNCAGIRTES